ncbi:hypothetical protein D3C78_1700300 [compost metagenome]
MAVQRQVLGGQALFPQQRFHGQAGTGFIATEAGRGDQLGDAGQQIGALLLHSVADGIKGGSGVVHGAFEEEGGWACFAIYVPTARACVQLFGLQV